MIKIFRSATLAALLLAATPALAEDLVAAEQDSSKPYAGLTLCFANDISHIVIMPQVGYVESAVIIKNEKGDDVVKANSAYGEKGVGSYWTTKMPRNVALTAGCYSFFFMIKSSPSSTSVEWSCAPAHSSAGPTQVARQLRYLTVAGYMGGNLVSGFALIPSYPTKPPEIVRVCPRGF